MHGETDNLHRMESQQPNIADWISKVQGSLASRNDGIKRFFPSARRRDRTLAEIQNIIAGNSDLRSTDLLRTLIAIGIANWSESIAKSAFGEQLPSAAVGNSFSTFALWPLVTARTLPDSWFNDLSALSSPAVARLVEKARAKLASHAEILVFEAFARALLDTIYKPGILNVLKDLNDNERGAHSFTLVFMLQSTQKVPRGLTTREFFLWLASSAVSGAVGNAFWEQLQAGWATINPYATVPSSATASTGHASHARNVLTSHDDLERNFGEW